MVFVDIPLPTFNQDDVSRSVHSSRILGWSYHLFEFNIIRVLISGIIGSLLAIFLIRQFIFRRFNHMRIRRDLALLKHQLTQLSIQIQASTSPQEISDHSNTFKQLMPRIASLGHRIQVLRIMAHSLFALSLIIFALFVHFLPAMAPINKNIPSLIVTEFIMMAGYLYYFSTGINKLL